MTQRDAYGSASCILLLAAILFSNTSHATTIQVAPGESLGAALAASASGDTIIVQCGTYAEQGLQMVDGVTLRSESGDPDCVTIESAGTDPILTCESLVGMTRIEGITFTTIAGGMTTPVPRGAGMLIRDASPSITGCKFTGLKAGYGGAVYCGDGAAPTFSGCSFEDNSAVAAGGALNCVGTAAPIFTTCLFTANDSSATVPAVNIASGASPSFITCTLADNGGTALLSWDAGIASLEHSIVTGLAWTGDASAIPQITCSDLFLDGEDVWAGLLADQAGQSGNISASPQFCGVANPDSPYSLSENSPCLNTAGCDQMGAFAAGCLYTSGVDDQDIQQAGVPGITGLDGNFPNPFNPSTTIRYNLHQAGAVKISVFDLRGRLVRQLVDKSLPAGSYEVRWNGTDASDRTIAAGVYFVRLKTDRDLDTSRLSLIK